MTPADRTVINVDDLPVFFEQSSATGREIKIAARIDPSFRLWLTRPTNRAVEDEETVVLRDGMRFDTVPAGHF